MDGCRIVQMLFTAASPCAVPEFKSQICFQSQRIKCLRMQVVYLLLNIFYGQTTYPTYSIGKVLTR